MAYIGRQISNVSDRVVLDNITTSATATYNLLLNSVAYVPSSAESLTVSLNGVIQKPQGSFQVSNSTIVFDSALTSSDSIDFILAERAITLTTVGSGSVGTSQLVDGNVTTAKIADSAVTNAKITDGTIANAKLANSSITLNGSAVSLGGSATIGGGKIGQVVSTHTNATTFSTSSTTPVDVTGMSVAITPSASSSKVLIQAMITFAGDQNQRAFVGLKRGSTVIANGTAVGSRMANVTTGIQQLANNNLSNVVINFLDTPNTTSSTTYQITGCCESTSSFYLNRSQSNNDASTVGTGASTITVMEVLA